MGAQLTNLEMVGVVIPIILGAKDSREDSRDACGSWHWEAKLKFLKDRSR